eukprot:4833843-Alexandrium_andersonii.AAC.1
MHTCAESVNCQHPPWQPGNSSGLPKRIHERKCKTPSAAEWKHALVDATVDEYVCAARMPLQPTAGADHANAAHTARKSHGCTPTRHS